MVTVTTVTTVTQSKPPNKNNTAYLMPLLWFGVYEQNPDYFIRLTINLHNLRSLDRDLIKILSHPLYGENKVQLAKYFITPHGEYYFHSTSLFSQIAYDLYMAYLMADYEH